MAGENGNNAPINFLIKHLEWVNKHFPAKEVLRKPRGVPAFTGRFVSGIRPILWQVTAACWLR